MSILLELLEKCERCSGLKINQTKSEAMWLGKWKSREDTPFNIKWQKDSVLTLLSRINIVKSLGLSKLIFNASVLPVPKTFCDQLNKITFNFIWDNKVIKIKNNTIIGERDKGGLNMIDFTLMNKVLKCIWIKRLSLNENSAWTVVPNQATSHLGGFTFPSTCNCKSNKNYHSFMKERCNIGLSLEKCRATRSHVQRTRILKLITKRYSSILGFIKEFRKPF